MDSSNSNSMRFSSYISGAGDPFFISPPPPPPLPPSAAPPRTSKKRSRPSRRAPTTVLSTDTSNFRAMVQVFTGIPSPPLQLQLPPGPGRGRSFSLNFPPPLLLPPFSSSPKILPPSSIPAFHQTPINANRISPPLFQSVPPFASPDQALLTDASEDADGGFGGESVRLASWICSSD